MAAYEQAGTIHKTRPFTNEDGHDIPASYSVAYVKMVEDMVSQPHRVVVREDQLSKEFTIAADGTTRTGKQILDEAGVTL